MAGKADLIFIQRKLFSPWLVRQLLKRCDKLVYDFDDAIFSKSNGDPSQRRMHRFQKMVEAATLVLASNAYLAERCVRADREVDALVVPTPVDEQKYQINVDKETGCILVWIGSSSTRKYLEHHREIFEAIGRKFPKIVLRIIPDFEFHLDNMTVENIQWSAESEARYIASAHVGIARMVDNQYTRSKCALKIIQYMAAGLPVISSKVGANQEVVVNGETGVLASSTDEWLLAVERLSMSQEERERMGAAGGQRMLDHFSQHAIVKLILDNLEKRKLLA